MGEWTSVTFQIGGKVTREQAEKIVAIATEHDLKTDWGHGDPASVENIGEQWQGQANYGNVEDLENLCVELGVAYERWCDSGPEWSASIERFAHGECHEFICDSDNRPLIALEELTKLDALATGWAELHAQIKWWALGLPEVELV